MSLIELLDYLETTLDKKITPLWDEWRPGDQPVFVCDLKKANDLLDWQPEIRVKDGVVKLINWVRDNAKLFV